MNRIYRVVWNDSSGSFEAVPECARSRRGGAAAAGVVAAFMPVLGLLALSVALSAQAAPPAPTSLPTQGQVSAGQAEIGPAVNNTLTIRQTSERASINWGSFDIGAAASVNFVQPGSSSATLNRVQSSAPSQIFGKLQSNGQVFLLNPNGVLFGATAQVDVGGLVASTHALGDADFMAGRINVERSGATGAIVNEGNLQAALGGYIALLAPEVRNEGVIIARQGTVALASGEAIRLQFEGGSLLGLTVTPSTIASLVANRRAVQAPGGLILLAAQSVPGLASGVIQNSGSLSAGGAALVNGRLLLQASSEVMSTGSSAMDGGSIDIRAPNIALLDQTRLDATDAIHVGGEWQGSGSGPQARSVYIGPDTALTAGREIVAWSNVADALGSTRVYGKLSAPGGRIETSGHFLDVAGIRVLAADWLLDPYDITIDGSGPTGTAYSPTYTSAATSTILASSIKGSLDAGTSVTITTGSGGGGAGDINVNASIAKTAGGNATLTLQARNDIVLANNVAISSTSGTLGVVLNSDFDANGAGAIKMGSGSSISSKGGDITLGGGSAGNGTGFAVGNSGNIVGIQLTGATLNAANGAAGGNIALKGQGFAGSSGNQHGISAVSSSSISTSVGGTITLTGIGGAGISSSHDNYGVFIQSSTVTGSDSGSTLLTGTGGNGTGDTNIGVALQSTATVTSTGGNVAVVGIGVGTGSTTTSYGVLLNSSSKIQPGLNGSLSVTGTAGNASGTQQDGVIVNAATLTSSGGSVSVTGFGGGTGTSDASIGVLLNNGGTITAGNAGTVSVTGTGGAGSGTFNLGVNVFGSGSKISSGGGAVTVNGTGGAGAGASNHGVDLDTSALIGGGSGATVAVTGIAGNTVSNGVLLVNSSSIASSGNAAVTVTTDSLSLTSNDSISAGTGTVQVQNRTAGTLINVGGADVLSGSPLTLGLSSTEINHIAAGSLIIGRTGGAASGNLTVTSSIAPTQAKNLTLLAGGDIDVNTGTVGITTLANGNVVLNSDADGNGSGKILLNTNSSITSNGGTITLGGGTAGTGAGNAVGNSGQQQGIKLANATLIAGSGSIVMNGLGYAGNNFSNANGVELNGGSALSATGAIALTGTGGAGTGSSLSNLGVLISSSTVTGGSVSLLGFGGAAPGNANNGVVVTGSTASVTTTGGNTALNGTGGGTGTSGSNDGVLVFGGAVVQAGGVGTVGLTGVGGSGTGTFNEGVVVVGTNTRVSSAGGAVTLLGTGGGTGSGDKNYGVDINTAATVQAGGSGALSITGTGGLTTGDANVGIYVSDASTVVTSAGGAVILTGVGKGSGGSKSNYGVAVATSATVQAGGAGALSIVGTGGATTGGGGYGVIMFGGTITSGGGNVSVTGQGAGSGTGGSNGGVYLTSTGGKITAGGTGSVTVVGTGGGGTGTDNEGVYVNGTLSSITASGTVSVTGTGGAAGAGGNNVGIWLKDGGKISSTGGGTVTASGTGGGTAGTLNHGIYVSGSPASSITTAGGAMSLTGTAGGGGASYGVALDSAALLTAGGNAAITLTTDSLSVDATASISTGTATGTVQIQNRTAGTLINLGAADVLSGTPLTLGLTDAEIDRITAATLVIGRTGATASGDMTLSASISPALAKNLSLLAGGDITLNAGSTITTLSNGNVLLNADADGSGAGAIRLNGSSGSGISSNGGSITLGGGTAGTGASAALGSASSPEGVYLNGVSLSAAGGNISVRGTGSGGALNAQHGVSVQNSSISTTGGGTITVVGTGGASTGDSNVGIYLGGTGNNVTSTGGTVTLTGTGGGSGASASNNGVQVESGSGLQAAAGALTVNGTGGGGSGNANTGVSVGGVLTATGAGTVTVTGTGGSGTGAQSVGVSVGGASARINSGGGAVVVTGTAGAAATGTGNLGVAIVTGGKITGGSGATVTVSGTGKGSSGGGNHGVSLDASGSQITSTNGAVSITGTAAPDAASFGISLANSASIASGSNAAVTVTTDSINFGATEGLSAGSGTLTVQNRTAGSKIDVGGADVLSGSPLTLGLSTVELSHMTAGTLIVGRTGSAAASDLTVSASITSPLFTNLTLLAGGDIVQNTSTGITLLTNGNLVMNSDADGSGAGAIALSGSVSSNGGNITLGGGVTGTGTGQAIGSASHVEGVRLSAATLNAGSGTIAITGRGLAASTNSNYGVLLQSGSAVSATGGGAITLTGTGGAGTGTSSLNAGVAVLTASTIAGSISGVTTLNGTGGASTGGFSVGVKLGDANTVVSSGGGAISVVGLGGGTGASSASNYGVEVLAGAHVQPGGSGSLAITGTGGASSAANNYGVRVGDSGTLVSSTAGAVTVTGLGGGSGSSASGVGVKVENSGVISGGGTALVSVTGTGGGGSGSSNIGVYTDTSGSITSGGGAVNVTGIGGSVGGYYGVYDAASIGSGGNAMVTVTTDSAFVDTSTGSISAGTGTVQIQNRTAGTLINVGGADVLSGSPLTLGLSSAEINRITAGTLIIGRTGATASGDMSISTSIAPAAATNLSLLAGGDIVQAASTTVATVAAGNVLLNSDADGSGAGAIKLNSSSAINTLGGGNITLGGGSAGDGSGAARGDAANPVGVYLAGGSLSAAGGNISLRGQGNAGAISSQWGIGMNAASVSTIGSGSITLVGTGGAGAAVDTNSGVDITASSALTGAGAVTITGTGGAATGKNNRGFNISNNSTLTGGSGLLSITGIGGAAAGIDNIGVRVNGGTITAGTGGASISGTGGAGSSGTGSMGVYLTGTTGKIISTGGGALSVTGLGSASTAADQNPGVQLDTSTQITGTGAVTVTGTGGAGGSGIHREGVSLSSGSISSSSASGAVNVTGTGGAGSSGYGLGVVLSGSSAAIGTGGGNLSVQASGGSGAGTAGNVGLWMLNGATLSASGAGTVSVVGQGGSSGGDLNVGVQMSDANTKISSGGGAVSVTGTGAGSGSSGFDAGINLYNSATITAGGSGSVTVLGTAANLASNGQQGVYVGTSGTISSAGGTVSVTGQGYGGGSSQDGEGVLVYNGGIIKPGGTGAVTVTGTGATATGSGNSGVRVEGTGSLIGSNNGAINVTAATASSANAGLSFSGTGKIQSGSNNTVTLTADGYSGSGSETVSAGTGIVQIQNRTAGTLIDVGGADVLSGSPLTLGLTSAEINRITAGTLVIGRSGATASGTLTVSAAVSPTSATHLTLLGGGDIVQNAALATSGGNLIVNSDADGNGAGAIVLNSSVTSNGGNITLGGGLAGTGAGNAIGSSDSVPAGILLTGAAVNVGTGALVAHGQGFATPSGSAVGINITASSTVQASVAGSISLTGQGGASTFGRNYGVGVSSSTITGGNAGTVVLSGVAGAAGSNNYGISLGSATITSSGAGTVSLTGTGGGGSGGVNHGISGTGTLTMGSGALTLTGTGGAATGDNNVGINFNSTMTVNSAGGNVSLSGTGGGSGSSIINSGIVLTSAVISTNGAGNLSLAGTGGGSSGGANYGISGTGTLTGGSSGATTITGTGGASAGDGNYGIIFGTGTAVGSAGGNVSLNGMGGGSGSSSDNFGVWLRGTNVSAGGSGLVAVNGVGGLTAGKSNYGVRLASGSTVSSSGGTTVNATARGTGSSGSNFGLDMENASVITAAGSAPVAVIGTATGDTGSNNFGMILFDTSRIDSGGGTVAVTGTGTATSNSFGIYLNNSSSIASGGNAAVTVTTDTLDITNSGTSISAGTGTVTLRNRTAGTFVNLGGADAHTGSPLTLGLSAGELNRITAGTLVIGRNDGLASGAITVSSAVAPSNAPNVSLLGGFSLAVNAPLTVSGTLSLTPTTSASQNTNGAIKAGTLLLNGAGVTYALATSAGNDVGTLTATGIGSVDYLDSNALSVGTLGASGTVAVATAAGNLTLAGAVSSADISANAVVLNAGKTANAGTASGGDLIVSGGSVSVGSGGRATLYAGSVAGSTGLGALVGSGSGRFRYNADEVPGTFSSALGTGTYAIYREAATITVTVASASKTYDGLAYSGGAGYAVTGLNNGDSTSGSLAYGGSAQGAVHVAGSPYSITGSGLTSDQGYVINYAAGTLTVNTKALTASGSRVYDAGTTAAAGLLSLSGLIGSETLGLSGSGSVATKNIGVNKPVTLGSLTLINGTGLASDYALASAALSITAADVTVGGVTANSRVYDAGTVATLSGTATAAALGGDALSVGGTVAASFADKNVGTGKAVTVSGYTLGGADAANYHLIQPQGLSANITRANLAVTGLAATSRVYDTGTVAALTGSAAIAPLASDVLVLGGSGTGAFADKNVGTAKAVSVTGYTLSGADAGNYTLLQPAGLAANITAASVSVTGLTAQSRAFNGGTVAALTGSPGVAALGSDSLGLSGTAVGAFADKNVGTAKPVSSSGLVLTGADAGNYVLAQQAGLTANITAVALTVSSVNVSKAYDGTLSAPGAAATVISGALFGADSLSGGSFAFTDAHAGSGKTVTVAGVSVVDGNGGSNYALTLQNNTSSTITPKALTASGGRVYDAGTTAAAGLLSLSGLIGSETLGLSGSGSVATKNIGVNKPVTLGSLALSNGTGLASDYALASAALSITAADVTVGGVTANSRVYDAGTGATLSGTATAAALGGDALSVGGTVAASFADKNVGTGKAVTVSGYTLGGADAANYHLIQPQGLSANITRANLAVTGLAATSRVYDTGTVAALTGSAAIAPLASDVLVLGGSGTGAFADKNVGTAKAVSVTGYTLSGADAGNYTLLQPAGLAANITQASVAVTGMSAVSRVYDASTVAGLTGTAAVSALGSDALTVGGTAVAAFANKNVGTGKAVTVSGYTLGGADAGNYAVQQPAGLTATITQASLGISGVAAVSRVYDAGTVATLSGTPIVGPLSSDAVTVSGTPSASFADKNVGTGKAVSVSGYTLAGADAGNYAALQPTGLAANITAASVSVTGLSAVSRAFNGGTVAALIGSPGLAALGSDSLGLSGTAVGAFADKNVGTAKPVSSSGLVLAGADAGNYVLAQQSGLVANISPAAITVSSVNVSKVYDGGLSAPGAATTVVSGQMFGADSLLGGTFAFTDAHAGTGKTVTVAGVSVNDGNGGSNYALSLQNNTSSTITPKLLSLTGGRVYDASQFLLASVLTISTPLVGGETLSLSGLGVMGNKQVGSNKPATHGSLALVSATGLASDYALDGITATITPAPVSVTGVSVANKVYDAGTVATLTGTGAVAALGGDALSVSGAAASAAFADKNVGTAKPVAVGGYVLGGADAANYQIVQPQGLSAAITPASLAVTGLAALDKVYDASTAAPLSGSAAIAPLGADAVSLSGTALGSFSSKAVGTAKPVTVNGLALAGADAANYQLQLPTTLAADISPATLLLGGVSAVDRIYDGSTAAPLIGAPSISALGSDALALTGTLAADFADKHVGVAKPVSLSGLSLSGSDAANYLLALPTTLAASVTPADLTVGASTASKVYDGTTSASSSAVVVAGSLMDHDVLSGGSFAFADRNAGAGNKTVQLSGLTVADGNGGHNYTLILQDNTASTISPAPLTVSTLDVIKPYDGTTAAAGVLTVRGGALVGGDTLAGAAFAFADKNVGSGNKLVTVRVSNASVADGNGGNNYTVTYLDNLTSTINPALLSVTAPASAKVYDGSVTASGMAMVGALAGAAAGESIATPAQLAFADKNAGSGKTVNASGLSVSDANGQDVSHNYDIRYTASTLGQISQAPLTVTAVPDAKLIGQADNAGYSGVQYSPFVAGETPAVLGGALVLTRSNAGVEAVGSYANVLVPSGLTAANYAITHVAGDYRILAANNLLVRVADTSTVYASTPVYSLVSASYGSAGSLHSLSTANAISGSAVSLDDGLGGQAFFTVAPIGATLSSSGNVNVGSYALTDTLTRIVGSNFINLNVVGNLAVTPKPLTPQASSTAKVYDGTTALSGLQISLPGRVGGDDVSVSGGVGTLAQAGVGTGLAYSVNGAALVGADAGNYSAAQLAGFSGSDGQITPRALLIRADDASKTYGTALAGGLSRSGFSSNALGGETIASVVLNSAGLAAGAHVGGYVLTPSSAVGAVGGGFDAANYTISYVDGALAVTPATLTLSGSQSYNGRTAVAGAALTALGVNGEQFAVTGAGAAGNLASRHVQSNAALQSVAGLSLGAGTGLVSDYQALSTLGSHVSVTPALLVVSAADVHKVYDGSTAAATVAVVAAGSRLFGSDSLQGGSFAFSDRNAGSAKQVSVAGVTVNDGNGGRDYALSLVANTSSSISPAAISLSSSDVRKVYDGTTAAAGQAVVSSGRLMPGDGLSGGSFAFVDRNAETGDKRVLVSGISVADGNAGRNYTVTLEDNLHSAISAASLTVSSADVIKTYDGTTAATGQAVVTAGSLFSGDTLSGGHYAFLDKNIGSANKTVSVDGITLADGNGGHNYTLTVVDNHTSSINAAPLTVTAPTNSKPYDGTTNSVGPAQASLSPLAGAAAGERVAVPATLNFADKNVATGKAVVPSALGIVDASGADVTGNYAINYVADHSGVITAAPLLVTANADAKLLTQADPTGFNGVQFSGFKAGETAAVLGGALQISRLNAGVEAAGSYPGVLEASGLVGGNYAISYAAGAFTIVPAQTALIKFTNLDTVYATPLAYAVRSVQYLAADGSTIRTLTGSANGNGNGNDTFSYSDGLGGSLSFSVAPVNAGLSSSGHVVAGNYALQATGVQLSGQNFNGLLSIGNLAVGQREIAPLPYNVGKVYDGTTEVRNFTLEILGKAPGDVVTANGYGAMAQSNVGSNISFSVTGGYIAGADADNYYFLGPNSFTRSFGIITPAPLRLGLAPVSKVYDGTASAPLSALQVLGGQLFGSDTVSLSSVLFDNANAGSNKQLVASGLVLNDGNGGRNYTLTAQTEGTGQITPAPLTVSANADGRFVTQADTPGYAGARIDGFVHGETAAVLGGSLSISRPGAATDNAAGFYPGALVAGGLVAANYSLRYVAGDYSIAAANSLLVRAADMGVVYGTTPVFSVSQASYLDANGGLIQALTGSANAAGRYTFSDGAGGSASFVLGALNTAGHVSGAGQLNVGSYAIGDAAPVTLGDNFQSLVFIGTLSVAPKTITPTASGLTKTYDGTTAMPGLLLSAPGVLGGDALSISATGRYANKNAGSQLAYRVDGVTLAGADAANYQLAPGAALVGSDGVIAPRPLPVTGTLAADKLFDGSNQASLSGASLLASAIVPGDRLTLEDAASGSFDSAAIGTAKPVSAAAMQLGGPDAANYRLQPPSDLRASIIGSPIAPQPSANSSVSAPPHFLSVMSFAVLRLAGVDEGPLSFQVQLPSDTFVHSDGDASLSLEVRLASGNPAPDWLQFDPATLRLSGTAPPGLKSLALLLIARDAQGALAQTTLTLVF